MTTKIKPGFVLQYNELRGTMDVDAFYRADKAVEQAIYRVGEKHGINGVDELWLNNHVESLNPCPDAEHFQLAYRVSHDLVFMLLTLNMC